MLYTRNRRIQRQATERRSVANIKAGICVEICSMQIETRNVIDIITPFRMKCNA